MIPIWLQRQKKVAVDPGLFTYQEKPLEELPQQFEGAVEAPQGAVQEFQQQPGIMSKWRSDLRDAEQIGKALAVHINQFEQARQTVEGFVSAVNQSISSIESVAPSLRDSMARAKALLYKIRSGLKTSSLIAIKYADAVYAVEVEVTRRKMFLQHFSESEKAPNRPDLMVWDEFKAWYDERVQPKIDEGFIYKDFDAALQRAWLRYRDQHAVQIESSVEYLRRYAQAEDLLASLEGLSADVEQLAGHAATLQEFSIELEQWALALASENQQLGQPQEPLAVAADLDRARYALVMVGFDADRQLVNAFGTITAKLSSSIQIVDFAGKTHHVRHGMIVKAQELPPELAGNVTPQEYEAYKDYFDQLLEDQRQVSVEEQPGMFPPRGVPPAPEAAPPKLPLPPEFEEVELPEEVWERLPNSGRIRWAAMNARLIELTYNKQGSPPSDPETDVVKTYIVEPYSYRVKRPQNKGGATTWYFFAHDTQDNHIKGYLVGRIQDVKVMTDTFSPRWTVEFT